MEEFTMKQLQKVLVFFIVLGICTRLGSGIIIVSEFVGFLRREP